jgi:hypothetical protein
MSRSGSVRWAGLFQPRFQELHPLLVTANFARLDVTRVTAQSPRNQFVALVSLLVIVHQPVEALESLPDRFAVVQAHPNAHRCAACTATALPVERGVVC